MSRCFASAVFCLLATSLTGTGVSIAGEEFFHEQVAPILEQHCLACHNDERTEGGLSLVRAETAFAGGESGESIVPRDVEASYLIDQITVEDGKAAMPEGQPPLAEDQIATLRQWIADGADWPAGLVLEIPQWWSLQPLQVPELPIGSDGKPLANDPWVRNPVDAFVLAQLRNKGLQPAAAADRETLIRRLYYDLIGLPPTPQQVAEFVADSQDDAYEKLVDRLLASPRYGERWARHWLDVVHYGETHGYDKDKPRPNAWPYRDYVIRSLNEDKPYTSFVQEQVAGDVLFPGTVDGIEALGFIAAGPWDHVGHAEVPETKIDGKVARHLDRDDMVRNTMMTFMSLTVGCAQCHDHKFDPITQEDYYSLHAVFAALDRADAQYHDDPALTRQRQDLRRRGRTLQHREYPLKKAVAELEKTPEKEAEKETAEKPAPGDSATKEPPPELSAEEQQQLETKKKELAEIGKELEGIRKELGTLPEPKIAYIGKVHYGGGTFLGTGYQEGKPRKICLLHRGSVTNPGEEMQPGTLTCIEGLTSRFELPDDAPEGERRAALARWLTDLSNPLPWRSIANRIWQFHFGRGLVETAGDFGRMGAEPTHPQLLDYLAADFRDGGQSIKDLHRKIVTSATYLQQSTATPESVATAKPVDANNRFYWRMNRRRLEAEAVRDAVLQVAGKLDLKMGGPSFQDFVIDKPEHSPHYEYHRHDPEDPKSHRRSVYRFIVRSQTQPFMTVMDCADPSMLVAKRNVTISPLQSLALLNNQLTMVMSKHFAERVDAMGSNMEEKVAAAFSLALSRPPNPEELSALTQYAQQHGLANTCRVIYNLSEFMFVD